MLHYPKETWRLALLIIGTLLIASCVTLTTIQLAQQDRGLIFPHKEHLEDLDCTDCHDFSEPDLVLPDHNTCELCHEFDVDAPTPEDCGTCHKEKDYAVLPWEKALSSEVLFDHTAHIDAAIECSECHDDPAKPTLPKGYLKPFCMDCHQEQEQPDLLECSTCHKTLNKNTVPTFRKGQRIAHDAPDIWKRLHGQEAMIDKAYCAMCHNTPNECDACHRQEQPQSHTLSWRTRTHGRHANFDRAKCAVCHEQDMCQRCHQNTKPASHRAGFGGSLNRHCMSCHFPEDDNNCSVCHESAQHRTAVPSVHGGGDFPPNCAQCHPRGNPFRAPHFTNSTVECQVCHQ